MLDQNVDSAGMMPIHEATMEQTELLEGKDWDLPEAGSCGRVYSGTSYSYFVLWSMPERMSSLHGEPVPGCLKTRAFRLHRERGLDILRIEVKPGGSIPLHIHDCSATMYVFEGTARLLGREERWVGPGVVIKTDPGQPHGFDTIAGDFCFISISDSHGIARDDGWDMQFPV